MKILCLTCTVINRFHAPLNLLLPVNPSQRRTSHNTIYLHMPEKFSQKSVHIFVNCALHIFLCPWSQSECLAIALSTYLDRTPLETCMWISRKTHCNLLH